MKRKHGVLTYVDLREMREDLMTPLLDAETEALISGPGQKPEDYPWLPGHRIPDDDTQLVIFEDGVAVGLIGFSPSWGFTDVGFWLTASARRRGILTTAWEDLNARYGTLFEAGTWERNGAARAFLASIGFRETGITETGKGRAVHLTYVARDDEHEKTDGGEPGIREENDHEQAA